MTKLFSDPIYKDMSEKEEGWLELAIEPYHFQLNNDFAALPDKLEIDVSVIESQLHDGIDKWGTSITVNEMIQQMAAIELKREFSSEEMRIISSMYEFQGDKNLTYDAYLKELSGKIVMVKKAASLPEDEIPGLIARLALAKIEIDFKSSMHHKSQTLSRMNEIIDLLGTDEGRKTRSVSKKEYAIKETFKKIILEDKWRVKSASILINAGKWIHQYCVDGNKHAIMNFTRLKCMTHKGNPIYSMEELT